MKYLKFTVPAASSRVTQEDWDRILQPTAPQGGPIMSVMAEYRKYRAEGWADTFGKGIKNMPKWLRPKFPVLDTLIEAGFNIHEHSSPVERLCGNCKNPVCTNLSITKEDKYAIECPDRFCNHFSPLYSTWPSTYESLDLQVVYAKALARTDSGSSGPPAEILPIVCECGGEKIGLPHSAWCPKYEDPWK